jgi:hypothetical protein
LAPCSWRIGRYFGEAVVMMYKAEMGFTHRELLKGLPNAVVPYDVTQKSTLIYSITNENRVATLSMGLERVRKIAALSLPVIDVEIRFENFDELQFQAFMDRFKKFLHRGGG